MQTEDKRRLLNIAAVIAVAAMLLWPAFVNGEPFYMADTSSYLRGADGAVHRLTGESSAWTNEFLRRFPPGVEVSAAAQSAQAPVVLAGRSIYYGLLLYGAQWFGNFWALAILQSLLVAVAIVLTIGGLRQSLTSHARAPVIVSGLLLAACTPAGYFASYLLPDVFGALGLLAFGHLAFLWRANGRPARAFWFAVLAAAMLFHTANLLLVGCLAIAAGTFFRLKPPVSRLGLQAVLAALLVAVAGQALFSWGVRQATGFAPVRPPFIAARIIADGPGYDYLREHCPEVRLVFCRAAGFRERISDALLWSRDPREGIFQALPPAEQRLASSQERRFVLAVLRDRPLELIGSSVGAVFRQLTLFNLESFNYTPANVAYFNRKIPAPFIDSARRSKAYNNRMPVRAVEWATVAAVLASLVAIAWAITGMVRRDKRLTPPAAFLSFMVVGVLLNAAVCGAVSTPKGRYQMRLIWVLPLVALASHSVRRRRRLESPAGETPVRQPTSVAVS